MKNNQKKDKHSFDKIKTTVISVIVSVILWVAIVNIVNPDVTERFYNIPIQANGTSVLREKGLVMVNTDELPTCTVKVRGKRKDIIEAMDRVYAVVNVSDITRQGAVTVPVIINSPSAVNVEKQSLASVEINIEPSYEKDIPIMIKQEGVADNLLIKSVPENATVKISGSKKDLEAVKKCLITADLSETAHDTSTMYPFVYLTDENVEIPKPDTVYCVSANLLVSHTVYQKKTAPARLEIPTELTQKYRMNINTDEIEKKEISYGVKEEKTVERIEYILDAEAVAEGQNEIKPAASELEGVYIPKNQLVLRFDAKKLVTQEAEVSVTTENLADNLLVSGINVSKKFRLTGTEDELTNVKAVLDLKGLGEGVHNVVLRFSNKKLQPKQEYFAAVTITGKGE